MDFTSALCGEGCVEKVVPFSKRQVSHKGAFWRHTVASMVSEHWREVSTCPLHVFGGRRSPESAAGDFALVSPACSAIVDISHMARSFDYRLLKSTRSVLAGVFVHLLAVSFPRFIVRGTASYFNTPHFVISSFSVRQG